MTGMAAAQDAPDNGQNARERALSLAAMAQERGRDVGAYAGLRFLPDSDKVELFVTRDDQATLAKLRRAEDADAFVVVKVARGYDEMLALRDRIRTDVDELRSQGLKPVSWGPNLDNNGAFLTLETVTPQAQAMVDKRYGQGLVTVEQGSPLHPFASRLVDNAPWNGGDFIATDNTMSGCTSGPPVRNSAGATFFVTAAHCFATAGDRVLNGSHGYTGDNPRVMGTIARLEPAGSGYDGALVAANTSTLNWRTGTAAATSPSTKQYDVQGSVVGNSVCASGAYSGERCGAVVQRVNVDGEFTGNGGLLQNMVVAAHPNGIAVAGPGDSGGPVYSVQSPGLLIQGIINGGFVGRACPNDAAMIPEFRRGDSCASTFYYHDAVSLFAHMGVSLRK